MKGKDKKIERFALFARFGLSLTDSFWAIFASSTARAPVNYRIGKLGGLRCLNKGGVVNYPYGADLCVVDRARSKTTNGGIKR